MEDKAALDLVTKPEFSRRFDGCHVRPYAFVVRRGNSRGSGWWWGTAQAHLRYLVSPEAFRCHNLPKAMEKDFTPPGPYYTREAWAAKIRTHCLDPKHPAVNWTRGREAFINECKTRATIDESYKDDSTFAA